MKIHLRIAQALKAFYDQSPQRFWKLVALTSIGFVLLMLVASYAIDLDFFINITLNFIVTAIGMIITFILFDKRMDKIRERIDVQRNDVILEKLSKLEKTLMAIEINTIPKTETTEQEVSTARQRKAASHKSKKK